MDVPARSCRCDGRRPRERPPLGAAGADVRRRARPELRAVGHAGAPPRRSPCATSTRPFPDRSSGTSNASPPAWSSSRARTAWPTRWASTPSVPACGATGTGCVGTPAATSSPSGTTRSTSRSCSTHFPDDARGAARRQIEKKARKRGHQGAFDRLVEEVDGRLRIRENPPVLTHVDDPRRFEIVHEVFDRYRETLRPDRRCCLDRFTYTDVVRQVVGVGSVGMLVHLVLLTGPRRRAVVPAGQAGRPVGLRGAPGAEPCTANHAARVVNGQRLIQSATDMFAGWTSYERQGLLRPAVPRHEGHPGHPRSSRTSSPTSPARAGKPLPRRMPARVTPRRSTPTWVATTPSPRR